MLIDSGRTAAADAAYLVFRRKAWDDSVCSDGDMLGGIKFTGMNDAGTPEEVEFARIQAKIVDVSDGAEDGSIYLKVVKAGTLVDKFYVGPGAVQFMAHYHHDLAIIDAKQETTGSGADGWVQTYINRLTRYIRLYASQ